MRFLPHIIAVIALTLAGLFLYKLGQSSATVTCEQGKTQQVISAATQGAKSGRQRDKVDHEVQNTPDTALDAELHALGVLRD